MTTMLERAARALYERRREAVNAGIESGHLDKQPWEPWEEISSTAHKVIIQEVRAVLQAIREPNERMVEAAWAYDHAQTESNREPYSVLPDEYWQAMIDAALDEGA